MAVSIHPSVDQGVQPGSKDFAGGTLTCQCASAPVTVSIKGNVAHNHACGCTKCWKPKGAAFSVVAVVGRDNLSVTSNGNKLKIVDPSAAIQRYACTRLRRTTCTDASRTRTIRSTGSISCTWSCPRTRAGRRRNSQPSCLVHHRVGNQARPDGCGPLTPEGAWTAAV